MKILKILVIITVLLTAGCKKYDEGPGLTFRTAKNRLTRTTWRTYEYTTSGLVRSSAYWDKIKRTETFKDNGEYELYEEQGNGNPSEVKGTWEFKDNHNKIEFKIYNVNRPDRVLTMTYYIKELSKDKFHYWMDGTFFGRPASEETHWYCKPIE